AKVVLAARSAKLLDALAAELDADQVLTVATDVADCDQVHALMQVALDRFGKIDILVNNAALGLAGPVATMDVSGFERIFAINVLGPLRTIQAAVPHMRGAGGGLIINVSSMVTRLTIPKIGG